MATHTVGISEMKVTDCPDDILVTYSLGSCIGVTIYDPEAMVGGMIHCMLPLSSHNKSKSEINPCMFTDTGIVKLLKAIYDLGGSRKRLIVKAAGASNLLDDQGLFMIGKKNHAIMRKVLWKNNILIASEDVGGSKARTLYLHMATGITIVKSGGKEVEL